MLDNPVNTQRWLNDPDTGAILIQISRIYHAERCSGPPTVAGSDSGPSVARVDPQVLEAAAIAEEELVDEIIEGVSDV